MTLHLLSLMKSKKYSDNGCMHLTLNITTVRVYKVFILLHATYSIALDRKLGISASEFTEQFTHVALQSLHSSLCLCDQGITVNWTLMAAQGVMSVVWVVSALTS